MNTISLPRKSADKQSSVVGRGQNYALLPHAAGTLLAAMPGLSFALQFWFSLRDDTLHLLFSHYTVSCIDWIFVPFNFFVVRAVDWRRGGCIFFAAVVAIVFNIATHAFWQYALVEHLGHMFAGGHVVLLAGWVHVGYATVQATLILAFLFVRQPSSKCCGLLSWLCVIYFVSGGVSGYIMNKGFMITDVLLVSLGLAFTLIYPRFAYCMSNVKGTD